MAIWQQKRFPTPELSRYGGSDQYSSRKQIESWISVQVTHCPRGALKHSPPSVGPALHPTVKRAHQGEGAALL